MPPLHIENTNHALYIFYYIYNSPSLFSEKGIEPFVISITCSASIASNKRRQEQNELTTTQRVELKIVTTQNPNANPNKNGQVNH